MTTFLNATYVKYLLDSDLGVSMEVSGWSMLHPRDPLLLQPDGHGGGGHGMVHGKHGLCSVFTPMKKKVKNYQRQEAKTDHNQNTCNVEVSSIHRQ